ncbi:MAG: NAD(P)H-dependent oxidoreductase [Oscillospiraceae bacterium]|nr:NAD(P)H-dependent oxidoreductase [Oscillospiraceae bacterium]
MRKILVAYFSASGTTARLAKNIADTIGGDLFAIEPVEPYTAADLNWNNAQSRSSVEMNDKSSRVAVAGRVENMADYDTVLIGYPIWWGVAPHIINSFLEGYDLTGKTVIPFATSGGSGIGSPENYLKASAKGATLRSGKLLRVTAGEAEIKSLLR